jgi:hypothetical protein
MITVHQVEQGTEEWQQLRADLYTGTGADKLLSYSGQVKIVNGVVSSYALSEITGFRGNFHTRRGHKLEDEALELYALITKHHVSRPGFITNSKYPECGYSPDGLDDDLDLPLEVKAFEESKHMAMFNAKRPIGQIPLKVVSQVHFGQFIWEKKGARLIIYNPDLDAKFALKIIDIRYNRNIQSNFRRKLSAGKVAA